MAQRGPSSIASRMAVSLLMAVALLLGPLGIGEAVAAATGGPCESSCPCDARATTGDAAMEHAAADGQGSHETGFDDCTGGSDARDSDARHSDGHHDESSAHHDDCADGCSDCGCCPGVVLGVLPQVLPCLSEPSHDLEALTRPDSPASVTAEGVFRPPRSRA